MSPSSQLAVRDLKPVDIGDVDAQIQSPLFSGLIPPEIRAYIFELATAEYIVTSDDHFTWSTSNPPPGFPSDRCHPPYQIPLHDNPAYSKYTIVVAPNETSPQWPPEARSRRPKELSGRRTVSTGLLRTCKRIYLETQSLPYLNKEHVFWHAAGPVGQPYDQEEEYFQRFRPEQLRMIKSLHLYTQQYWLEGGFENLAHRPYMQGIEKLRITMRSGDWWFCERNAPLVLDPQASTLHKAPLPMDELGEAGPWHEGGWANGVQRMAGLNELVMEFTTFGYKEAELGGIIRRAQRWRFDMVGGGVLSAEGLPVVKNSWEGHLSAWAQTTPYCRGHDGCDYCEKMDTLKKEGRGPMLVSMTVTWKRSEA